MLLLLLHRYDATAHDGDDATPNDGYDAPRWHASVTYDETAPARHQSTHDENDGAGRYDAPSHAWRRRGWTYARPWATGERGIGFNI